MPLNITIDRTSTAHNSDRSHSSHSGSSGSYTDEEDSNDTGVHLPSAVESQLYSEYSDPVEDDSWNHIHREEIGPSESASRPRTSNQHRPVAPDPPQPKPARRQSIRREVPQERIVHRPHPRTRAPPPPSDSGSVDYYEEWPPAGYVRAPHPPAPVPGRAYAHWAPSAGNPPPGYAHSYSSAPGFPQYPPTSGVPAGQLVPFGSPAPFGLAPYQTGPPGGPHGYFPPAPHISPMAHPVSPYSGQDLIHHPPPSSYFPPPQSHPMPVPIPYPQYVPVYSPPPPAPAPTPAPASTPAPAQPTPPPPAPAPAPPETPKDDERFARLEQILIDERTDRENREAAAKQAAEEAAAKAAAEKLKADEIAAASSAAAATAKKEAEDKAAEDAAKAKEAADAEMAKAKEEAEAEKAKAIADATPASPPPPEERKKPIKFKDAVGRKFQFPFHLCNTWMGMEDLIRQAFLHVEVIGPHVAEGHYDLVGPTGEIILPQVWETVVEPDWNITMHMWPMPEPPPPEETPPAPPEPPMVVVPEKGAKKPPKKPSGLSGWLIGGGGRAKPKPKPKIVKKT